MNGVVKKKKAVLIQEIEFFLKYMQTKEGVLYDENGRCDGQKSDQMKKGEKDK